MNPDYSFFNKSPPSVFSDSFEDDFNERIGSPLGTSFDYIPSDHDSFSGERFFLEDLDLNKDSPPSIGTGTSNGSTTVTFAATPHHQNTTALPISMSQQYQQPKIKRQESNMSFSMPTHYSSPFTIPVSTTSSTTMTTADDSSLDKSNSRKERNRLAAERCRNRRSQMMSNLQMECDKLRQERDKLLRENGMLLEIIRRSSSKKD